MKKQNKKGFTLVELLVVIAILAILATVSVVGYSQFTEKAKKSNDETELHQIALIVEAQLIDGEEIVYKNTYDSTNTTTLTASVKYTVTYVDSKVSVKVANATVSNGVITKWTDSATAATSDDVTSAIKLLAGEENAALIAGDNLKVTLTTTGVLSLEYKHNAKTTSTWTLGEQLILAILATVSVVGYSQFTKKAKESNDNTELHQYVTLIQAALIDGEEEVTITKTTGEGESATTTSTTYKVTYKNVDGKDTIEVYTKNGNAYGETADSSVSNETITSIVNAMLIGKDEAITGATLSATLTNEGALTLHYVHHSDAGVDWTFTYYFLFI